MHRKFLIAGNWKMHLPPAGAFDETSPYRTHADVDVIVFPTFVDLKEAVHAKLLCGAQTGHPENTGAHTGDISMKMVKDIGCLYVLCGHSERRKDHGETNEQVAAQAVSALEHGLHPVICIGETQQERDSGKEKDVIKQQMDALPLESDITIAYEPVWAIGTGNTATPEQAQDMHSFIRSLLPEDRREVTRILYGGSMKPDNCGDLLCKPDIDGGLIGGASLKPDQFADIVSLAVEHA